MRERLENGAQFPLAEISEDERMEDLRERLQRGNHKSAKEHDEFLETALKQEVTKGWLLPLPAEKAAHIPTMEMAPLGVAVHQGISADGDYIAKSRVTHDLSFPGAFTNESINSRVMEDRLEPCMFGHMLSRLLHYIISVRERYPNTRIWLRKEDLKKEIKDYE